MSSMDDRLPQAVVDRAVSQADGDRWLAYNQSRIDASVEQARSGQVRWRAESLLPFAVTGTGLHLTTCHVIQNLAAACDEFIAFPPRFEGEQVPLFDSYPRGLDEATARTVGRDRRRCQLCAPGIPTPPKRPRKPVRSGLGWPTSNGKCAKYDHDH